MSKTQIVTLRVPVELKTRLEHEAKHQGVSLNNLANYLLTTQLTEVETLSQLDERLSNKNISDLKSRVRKILEDVPTKKVVPDWDNVK